MNQIATIEDSAPLTKGEALRILNQSLPLNQYKIPDYVYRIDIIPDNILELPIDDRNTILMGAELPVTFEHGYPAIQQNRPLWEQLPAEPHDAFSAFMTFLELPEKSGGNNPIRLLPLIATATKQPVDKVTEWCHLYIWHWRARAYDLFLRAAHIKQREFRLMSIEGNHFRIAEKILQKIEPLIESKIDQEIRHLEEDQDADTPTSVKDLVGIMRDIVSVQRISVGLPANGVQKIEGDLDGRRGATAADTFKHIAKESTDEEGSSKRTPEMDKLLESPDDLARMQEMMIKLQKPEHTLPAWGGGKVIDVEAEDIEVVDTSTAHNENRPPDSQ